MTNADKIRNMTDEELSEFICHNTSCQTCGFCSYGCDLDRWLAAEHDKEDDGQE